MYEIMNKHTAERHSKVNIIFWKELFDYKAIKNSEECAINWYYE